MTRSGKPLPAISAGARATRRSTTPSRRRRRDSGRSSVPLPKCLGQSRARCIRGLGVGTPYRSLRYAASSRLDPTAPRPSWYLANFGNGTLGMSSESPKSQSDFMLIGSRLRKVDGLEKSTGQARFTDDLVFPGMLHGKILRSPHPHARIPRSRPLPTPSTTRLGSAWTRSPSVRRECGGFWNTPVKPARWESPKRMPGESMTRPCRRTEG